MFSAQVISLCLLGVSLFSGQPGSVDAKATITNVDVSSDPDYVKSMSNLKKTDGRVLTTVDVQLLQDIEDSVMVQGSVSILNNGKYEKMIKIEPVNFCKFLHGSKKSPILSLAWKLAGKYGRVPSSCPIKKGHYYVNELEIEDDYVPAATPSGDYQVEIISFLKEYGEEKVITKLNVFVTIDQEDNFEDMPEDE